MLRAKVLISALALVGCFADGPTEPPFAISSQLSVSVSLSRSTLGPGDTIDVTVRVQNLSAARVTYSYSACPISVEFLAASGGSAFLHPPPCILLQEVHVLGPNELSETRYQFDGHAWPASSSEYLRLSPGPYQVVVSIERRDDFASAPIQLEVY